MGGKIIKNLNLNVIKYKMINGFDKKICNDNWVKKANTERVLDILKIKIKTI